MILKYSQKSLRLATLIATLFLSVLCLGKEKSGTPVPFADPFIFEENGTYYLYGTHYNDGIGVLVSKDMRHWSVPGGKDRLLALDKIDSYGTKWFWAPEVYKIGSKYLMYYSADEHICAAESDSPLGPFVQKYKKPMLKEKGIDCSLFIDNGKPYIYWVRFMEGNIIWCAELEEDCQTIKKETMRFCIRPEEAWEKIEANVTEGPFVEKYKGKYYMTYSANAYTCQSYAIGYAVSDSPMGPWIKSEDNPILVKPGDLVGVGHHALFRDKRGRRMIVFHSHYSDTKIQPRVSHISTYRYVNGGKLKISPRYFTCTLSQ